MRKKTAPAPEPRNTRALARKLFPDWSRQLQAQWVLAKLRLRTRAWAFPVSSAAKVEHVPDFLRALPRHEVLDLPKPTARERVQRAVRVVSGR